MVAETVGPQHARGHGTRPCWPSRVPPRSQQETDRLHLRTSLAKLKTMSFTTCRPLSMGIFNIL